MGKPYFIVFDNKSSYNDLGLRVVKRPIIPLPKRKYNQYEIVGSDGDYYEDLEVFDDIKIEIEFNFIDRTNIYNKIRKIMTWLNVVDEYKLSLADDYAYFYKVKSVSYTDIERQLKIKGVFVVTFICEAFKYSVDNDLITITSNNQSIYSNEFTYNSKPILNIYGSGDITLTINDIDILLNGITDNIIINSTIKEAYNTTFENLNNKMNGDFPILISGINTISWIGNVTKIEITPNWRSL